MHGSGVAVAMRRRQWFIHLYMHGLNSLSRGDEHPAYIPLQQPAHRKAYRVVTYVVVWSQRCRSTVESRDEVLEASASARGGLEAVFLTGLASPRPHRVFRRFWLGLVFDVGTFYETYL